MLKTYLFLGYLTVAVSGVYLISIPKDLSPEQQRVLKAKRAVVGRLGLTDPAIWTEARYTRHPSQADFFSPFQDAPGSFDHFPAASIIAPPHNFLKRIAGPDAKTP